MRVRLSTGEVIEVSQKVQRDPNAVTASTIKNRHTPSKRQVKIKGGSLKRWNSQKTNQSVGGYKNLVQAIGQPADKALCIVTQDKGKYDTRYTLNVGGSCSTGYIGGRGA